MALQLFLDLASLTWLSLDLSGSVFVSVRIQFASVSCRCHEAKRSYKLCLLEKGSWIVRRLYRQQAAVLDPCFPDPWHIENR